MGKIEEKLQQRIKKLRSDAGLSQVALANRAGVSVQTIKDAEAGRRGLGIKALQGISEALGLSIEQLRGEVSVRVEPLQKVRMSKVVKMIESIPDDIYDLASKIPKNDKAWDYVRSSLEYAIEKRGKESAGEKEA
jgi:transcriptional regulator with XRE-family HTH domain